MIDELMYINDGINPFRRLVIGYGGLNYHPYLPISGGAIGKGWEFEEEEKDDDIKIKPVGFKINEPINLLEYDDDELKNMLHLNIQVLNGVKSNEIDNPFKMSEIKDFIDNVGTENNYINEELRKRDKIRVLEESKKQNEEELENKKRIEEEKEKEILKSEMEERIKELEMSNLDELSDEELYEYLSILAYLHENHGDSKKNDITDIDLKIYKTYQILDDRGLEDIKNIYKDIGGIDDYEKKIDEWYIKPIEPDDYENQFIIDAKKITGNNYPEIGKMVENFYGNQKVLFEYINKYFDNSEIFNTSQTDNNIYYTEKMKKVGKELVKITGKEMKKSDLYLVDFVSNNNLYEMKALKDSYKDFYNKGSIHLVGTKVSENKNYVGKFIYDKLNNKVVVENIGYRDNWNEPIKFKTLTSKNYNYNAIYCLSDGIYYCNLSNPKLWHIDKNNKAYFKYPIDYHGNVKIPISFIERVDNNIVSNMFKNN